MILKLGISLTDDLDYQNNSFYLKRQNLNQKKLSKTIKKLLVSKISFIPSHLFFDYNQNCIAMRSSLNE